MTIAVRTVVNSPGSTANVTAFDLVIPADAVQVGDFMLWTLVANTATNAPTPTGWSVWDNNTTTGLNQSTFARYADADDADGATHTATGLTSARWGGAMVAYSGVDPTTAQDVAHPANTAGTTVLSFPAITPATAGAWIVSCAAITGPSGIQPGEVGWTIGNLDALDTDAGSNLSGAVNALVAHGHEDDWTSGAYTPTGPMDGVTTARTIGATWALRPATTPNTGAASGSVTWAGPAQGSVGHKGSASGTLVSTGSAQGTRAATGLGSGNAAWSGTAQGSRDTAGSSTGSVSWSGAATGSAPGIGPAAGEASGQLDWTGSTTGGRPSQGSASGATQWNGAASGFRESRGSAAGGTSWIGVAAGGRSSRATAAGALAWSGLASGARAARGAASTLLDWVGIATGEALNDFTPLSDPVVTVRANPGAATVRTNPSSATIREPD